MILVLYTWVGVGVRAPWNYSFDMMRLNYPVFLHPQFPSGRTVWGGCGGCWLDGRQYSITEVTGNVFCPQSPALAVLLLSLSSAFLGHVRKMPGNPPQPGWFRNSPPGVSFLQAACFPGLWGA